MDLSLIQKYDEHVLISLDAIAVHNGNGNILYPKNWTVKSDLSKLPDSYLVIVYYDEKDNPDILREWLSKDISAKVIFLTNADISIFGLSEINTRPWSINTMRVRLPNFPGVIPEEAFPTINPFDRKYKIYSVYAPDHEKVNRIFRDYANEVDAQYVNDGKVGELVKIAKDRTLVIHIKANASSDTIKKTNEMLGRKISHLICIVVLTAIPNDILESLPTKGGISKANIYKNINPYILNYRHLRYCKYMKPQE